MNLGEIHELKIEKLIYGGEGLGRVNNQTVFVPFAAPGDHLRIRITRLERNFARAEIVEILVPSAARRPAPCRHFGICGGCQLQHLHYEAQLQAKVEFIRESLKRIGGIDWQDEIKVLVADEFGYRSRAEIKISQQEHREKNNPLDAQKIQIGFFKSNSHEICAVTECPILLPAANGKLQRLSAEPGKISRQATRIYLIVGDDHVLATAATGENSRTAAIDALGTVHQIIAGITYEFGVRTFFQANRLLVEKLVAAATGDTAGKIAFDLYAGAGLFSLQLAQNFRQVYAVEGSKISVQHGIANAQNNRIKNVSYESMSVEAWLKHKAVKLPRPDFVLLDPPRAGAGEIVSNRLLALKPPKINYVSCDPATLARDLKLLVQGGYRIDSVTAVDMFPQTFHVETVVKLSMDEPRLATVRGTVP